MKQFRKQTAGNFGFSIPHPPSTRRSIGRLAFGLSLIACGFSGSAQAQIVINQQNQFQINEQAFLSMVLGRSDSLDSTKIYENKRLEVQLMSIAEAGHLSDSQIETLRSAGQGDLHRFFDDFAYLASDFATQTLSQQEYQELHQALQPLEKRYLSGLFGPESLLQKTVPAILSPALLDKWKQQERDRRRRHYQAAVKATVNLIENQCPLTQSQRERFEAVIMEKTRPLRSTMIDYYLYYYVMYQISTIPDDTLRPIFSDEEWLVIQRVQQQGRSMQRSIEQRGLLPDED